jgi:Mrp family chromosome partitioning ATPase
VITSEPEAVPQQFEPTIASLPPAWQPLRAAPAAPSAEAKPPQLLPALCEVPATGEAETAIVRAFEVISNPNTPYASGLVQVASWLASVRQTLGISSLAVGTVSDGLYESSTAAMALARSLARHSQRVIVVDAARDGRQLDPVAGLSPGAGLAEILMGNSKFAEVITSDGASSVHILRAGYGIDSAAAFFSTNRMDAILRSLEQNYDVLILSLGHIDRQAQGLGRFTQAGLILADPARADEVGAIAADWRHAGLRAVQFVRLAAASAVGGKRTPVKA